MAYINDDPTAKKKMKQKNTTVGGVKVNALDNGYRSVVDPGVADKELGRGSGSGKALTVDEATAALNKKFGNVKKP